MNSITEIIQQDVNINTSQESCAYCGTAIPPCRGICDYTNIGWKCWHAECYEKHRLKLGMSRRFPLKPRYTSPPRIEYHYTDESVWEFEGMTEYEFLGDVGDK